MKDDCLSDSNWYSFLSAFWRFIDDVQEDDIATCFHQWRTFWDLIMHRNRLWFEMAMNHEYGDINASEAVSSDKRKTVNALHIISDVQDHEKPKAGNRNFAVESSQNWKIWLPQGLNYNERLVPKQLMNNVRKSWKTLCVTKGVMKMKSYTLSFTLLSNKSY